MDSYRLVASGQPLNYLPHFVADDLGFYSDEDLAVKVTVTKPWPGVLDDLDAGRADAAVGGVWVPCMCHNRLRNYRAFLQISARCPMTMVCREPRNELLDLTGTVVLLSGGGGPSSSIFLRGVLENRRARLSDIRFVHDLATPMLLDLFLGGMGTHMVVDALTAETLRRSGSAHVVEHLCDVGGRVPWSVYYATESELSQSDSRRLRFSHAIARAMEWLHTTPDGTVIDHIVLSHYPAVHLEAARAVVNRFLNCGMWESTRIDSSALEKWQLMLCGAGLLDKTWPYEVVVDSHPTRGYDVT